MITKENLKEAYEKGKIGVKNKWFLKQHLLSNEGNYTPEARAFLSELAKKAGFTDEEIRRIGEIKKRNNSSKNQFLGFVFVFVFCIVWGLLAVTIFYKLSLFPVILISSTVTVLGAWVMFKRGL